MKHFLYFFLLIAYSLFSQNIGSNGVRSDSRINDLFEFIKNRVNKDPYSNPRVKGSEYFDNAFKPAEVKYFDKDLDDNIFLRYNAYKDEIEFSNNPKKLSSDKVLMKNMNISCSIEGEKYIYTNYINVNELRKELSDAIIKKCLEKLLPNTNFSMIFDELKIHFQNANLQHVA